jgi:restriction endonuclease Mrr
MTSAIWPSSQKLTLEMLNVLAESPAGLEVSAIDSQTCKKVQLDSGLHEVIRQGNRTEIQYRLAWVRTKAKGQGLIERTESRRWKITAKGLEFARSNSH